MICPICDSTLVDGPLEVYQNLEEHVSDPNGFPTAKETFRCPSHKCTVNTEYKGFWDWYGDYYCENYANGRPMKAKDSFAMKADVEIRKKDENFTFFRTYSWKFRVKFKYEADTFGNVVKRTPTLDIWKRHWGSWKDYFTYYFKDKNKRDFPSWCGYYTNGRMYRFCMKEFYKKFYEFDFALVTNSSICEDYHRDLIKGLKDLKRTYEVRSKGKWKFLGKWDWYRKKAYFKAKKEYKRLCKHYGLEGRDV